MHSIKFNKENNPILNQIYNILKKFNNQELHIILCKIPAHMGIKVNEAAMEAIGMPFMATTRLLPNY